nr:transposase [Rhizobium leguminosarum]
MLFNVSDKLTTSVVGSVRCIADRRFTNYELLCLRLALELETSIIEAVPERLEGAPRLFRRRWSDDFKARAVAEVMEPGVACNARLKRMIDIAHTAWPGKPST